MFSTCIGRAGVEDGSSCMSPLRRLKLTSRTMRLLDDTNSSGRPPDSELWDRLRRSSPVRLPRDGETCPSRPLEASETSVTAPSPPQAIPSHMQQSVLFRFHNAERPPSCDSPARKCRREPFSCSVQELAGEAMQSTTTTTTRAQPMKGKRRRRRIGLQKRGGLGQGSEDPHWSSAHLPQAGCSFLVHTTMHVSVEATLQ